MLFNSFPFIFLLLGTFVLYYTLFKNHQVQLLLLSSFTFYGYGQPYLLILLFVSASLNAIISYRIYWQASDYNKKKWATLGVLSNLLVLIVFKYQPFIYEVIGKLTNLKEPSQFFIEVTLPIGISFYTFQGISLVVDLYKSDKTSASLNIQNSFWDHYLKTVFFISFFPQLVAGPIEKAKNFYPQIMSKSYSNINWYYSFKMLITGYFFKMVIADNISAQTFWIAYPYYKDVASVDLIALLLGYSSQIFADFAGYSFIAIGLASLFGYQLSTNFNYPYLAQTFSELWTRWHISLSSWLKQYLYVPLGGNKKGGLRTYVNLFIVMLLGGLWHGASTNYLIWGAYHGSLLVIERLISHYFPALNNRYAIFFKIAIVFGFWNISWPFFLLGNFEQIMGYFVSICHNTGIAPIKNRLFVIFIYSMPVLFYHVNGFIKERYKKDFFDNSFVLAILLFLILIQGGRSSDFVYFQF